ncbi:MAG: YlbF family regulator [Lactobacillus sp.]|nr:YlbF family regulator [Lactobacillus sp.]
MINIFDSANQLASDLQQLDEFKKVASAIDDVKNDATSLATFQKMDAIQAKIMTAQSQGQVPEEADVKAYHEITAEMQKDKNIMALLQAEQALFQTMDQVQKTFAKPLNDLYSAIRK